ncbi:hypothetical protein P3T76_014722 [Phytophthora citrophthora]|uniref:Uncharacterized protein n=1 Tax=Phytophthora citrophthora TaxID=4793 RepID=A0AAD9G158_9STRA|nr:hypothetical protein P3T76_014722 [Phytophthora citrophthora]
MARIRSSLRGKAAATAAATTATARDIDFGHFWRQLRSAGWTAKKPSGLQNEWSYTSPDGTNVLVGEDAVVKYTVESGILDETRDNDVDEDARSDASSGEQVTVSQIDTSIKLSQGTISKPVWYIK